MTSKDYQQISRRLEDELKQFPDEYIRKAQIQLGQYIFGELNLNFAIDDYLKQEDRNVINSKVDEIIKDVKNEFTKENICAIDDCNEEYEMVM